MSFNKIILLLFYDLIHIMNYLNGSISLNQTLIVSFEHFTLIYNFFFLLLHRDLNFN